MNDPIVVRIEGAPVAKARARAGKFGHFTPKKTVNYEAWVKQCATEAMRGRERLEGAVYCEISIRLDIPDSWYAWKKQAALEGYIKPTSKPDLDNFQKSLFDGCNGIVFKDDSQVHSIQVEKMYSDRPSVVVRVWPVREIKSAAEWRAHLAQRAEAA